MSALDQLDAMLAKPLPTAPAGDGANYPSAPVNDQAANDAFTDSVFQAGMNARPTPKDAPAQAAGIVRTAGDTVPGVADKKQAEVIQPLLGTNPADNTGNRFSDIPGTAIIWMLLIGGLIGYFKMRNTAKSAQPLFSQSANDLVGVHGWLKFFVISLGILGPALSFGRMASDFHDAETAYSIWANTPAWATYKNTVWLTVGGFSAFSIYAALKLRFVWKHSSVTLAKIAVATWPFANIFVGFFIPMMVMGQSEPTTVQAVSGIAISIVAAFAWIGYLSMSKRVRATYIDRHDDANDSAVKLPLATPPRPKFPNEVSVEAPILTQAKASLTATANDAATEDELYEKIGIELDSGNTHTATWLKAFSQANGDENLAKASYIKMRIERLLSGLK